MATTFSKSSSVPPDVEIQIFDTTFQLHSTKLRLCSKFFDAGMSSLWWKDEKTHQGAIKYRYHLVPDTKDPMCSMVESVGPGQTVIDSIPDHHQDSYQRLTRAHSRLFGLFYLRPMFTGNSVQSTLSWMDDVHDVLILAGAYCALPTISSTVYEAVITRLSEGNPDLINMKELLLLRTIAIQIKSKLLFNDVHIHIIGRHLADEDTAKFDLGDLHKNECVRIRELQLKVERIVVLKLLEPE